MLSPQHMSDRLEIQDLLARYCDIIDHREWERLDDIFTPDAVIDYTQAGGIKGGRAEIKAFLNKALGAFSGFQHMIGLPVLTLNADAARARTILYNPMVLEHEGRQQVMFVGLWYVDELARTPDGWRITSRREEISYFHNMPAGFTPDK